MQILINSEKRRQLGLGERLRRLLSEKRRGQTKESDSDGSDLHSIMLSEVEASLKC